MLATAAAAAGVVGVTASAGVRDDMLVASAVAILAAGGVVAALARAWFVTGTLAAGAQSAWLTALIIDPNRSSLHGGFTSMRILGWLYTARRRRRAHRGSRCARPAGPRTGGLRRTRVLASTVVIA